MTPGRGKANQESGERKKKQEQVNSRQQETWRPKKENDAQGVRERAEVPDRSFWFDAPSNGYTLGK
jgi:hypothetical protein